MIDVGRLLRGNATSVRVLPLIKDSCEIKLNLNFLIRPRNFITRLFLHLSINTITIITKYNIRVVLKNFDNLNKISLINGVVVRSLYNLFFY